MNKLPAFAALLTMSALTLMVCPLIGQVALSYSDLFASNSIGSTILWSLRVPRVLLAFLVGSSLALSGMVFQAMFRNVLATPFTLGVSGGAAFGAALFFRFATPADLFGLAGSTGSALAGALASMLIIVGVISPQRGAGPTGMLLAGVMVSFFFSSFTLLLQYLSDASQVFQLSRWLMGTLDTVGYRAPIVLAVTTLGGFASIFGLARHLDILSLGDELAASRGVRINRTRLGLFVICSCMIATVVASCGPIGFVGLLVPIFLRNLFGASHRNLSIACGLGGGVFLTWCDTAARTLLAPAEMPVGVLTALLGVPCFIWVLRSQSIRT